MLYARLIAAVRAMAHFSMISALALALAGCDKSTPSDSVEDELAGSDDPAMRGALEDQILVDPELEGQSNRNAVLGRGDDGKVPSSTDYQGARRVALAAAKAELRGGKTLQAPAPKKVSTKDCKDCGEAVTLGAKAAAQQRDGKACDAQLSYDLGWAKRMPAEFGIYPRANLKEAAGMQGGDCAIRVINFTTPVGMKDVVDYYYTKARRGGYSAEYQIRDGEHVLGGVNTAQDGAFVIFLKPYRKTGTEVDIVANNGR